MTGEITRRTAVVKGLVGLFGVGGALVGCDDHPNAIGDDEEKLFEIPVSVRKSLGDYITVIYCGMPDEKHFVLSLIQGGHSEISTPITYPYSGTGQKIKFVNRGYIVDAVNPDGIVLRRLKRDKK